MLCVTGYGLWVTGYELRVMGYGDLWSLLSSGDSRSRIECFAFLAVWNDGVTKTPFSIISAFFALSVVTSARTINRAA